MVKSSENEKSTEEQIFDAAREVFLEKGFDGTRMQDISERAGINKALLHYYYRTKEKLFAAIFEIVMKQAIPGVVKFMESDAPLFEKIEVFVENYITIIHKNPTIPSFVINEINRNPEGIANTFRKIFEKNESPFKKFEAVVKKEIEVGVIEPIKAEQLVVNMIAMCIFPFVARPILQAIIFEGDKKKYDGFIDERKKEVSQFIINSIKKR